MNWKLEIERSFANGDVPTSSFSGVIPAVNSTCLESGDVFTVPVEFEIMQERIGMMTNEYIFVTTDNGDVRKLYPSQLSRSVVACAEDGNPCGRVIANGTASQLYRQYATVKDGMDALKGKTIRISKKQMVTTHRYGCTDLCKRVVYTFDLV